MRKIFLVSALAMVACGATRLNDVGDVDGEGDAGAGVGAKSAVGGNSATGGKAHGGTDAVAGSDDPPLNGNAGWPSYDGGLDCPTCEEVADAPDIRGIWLTSDRVYWTEFGTTDELDNYENDGRLMSMSLNGGSAMEVATGLEGPTWLAIGELYAYVWLERSGSPRGEKQLARISLDGGGIQLLQPYTYGTWVGQDLARRFFAFGGGYAHWFAPTGGITELGGTLFRLAEEANGPAEELSSVDNFVSLAADDSNLYVVGLQVQAFPILDGTPETVLTSDTYYDPMVLVGDAFFGFEIGFPNYTVTLPLAGGGIERVGKAENPYTPSRMASDGARFVASVQTILAPELAGATLVDGELTTPDDAVPLAIVPPWRDEGRTTFPSVRAWDANATDVYLGYEGKLYRIPRVTQ